MYWICGGSRSFKIYNLIRTSTLNFFWVELSLITQLYIVPTKVCLCHDDKDEKGDRKKALIASTQNHRKKKINPQNLLVQLDKCMM